MTGNAKNNWLSWLFYFIVFEAIVYIALQWLLSDLGIDNQYQSENTIVPNWVKAVIFILLYILCLLIVVMLVSNYVPSKHRRHLMKWVYLALLGMVIMLFFIY